MLRHDVSLKRLLLHCLAFLLSGVCPAMAVAASPDGIQRADLRVTSSEFVQHAQSLQLSGVELDLAKGAWGSHTFDLTHVESAYEAWFKWYGAAPPTNRMNDSEYLMRDWWSSLDQTLTTLKFIAVDRYFTQLKTLRPNDRRKIQSWRHRKYRKILSVSQRGVRLEGVNTDLVALLEDLAQDYPDLQFANGDLPAEAQKTLESYVLRMHDLIVQYVQVAITYRNETQRTFDHTQDDGLRDRIVRRAQQVVAPLRVAIEIRRLNRSTIDQLSRALPRDETDAFRKLALESVSPSAYTKPDYERLAEYAIESSLIESDIKDALQGLIKARKKPRLRLAGKMEKCYEAGHSVEEELADYRAYTESNAGLHKYVEYDSPANQNLIEATQELENYDLEGLAKLRRLLGRSFVVVQDARAAENRASEDAEAAAEAALERAVRERSSPRYDSPFITRMEFDAFLDSIDVVEVDQKQSILSHYEALAEKLRTALRAYNQERAQITPFSEVENLEDLKERGRRRLEIFVQLMELGEQWINTRRVIEREFTGQLTGGLTDDQTDDWYREVRRLRRFRIIPTVISRSHRDLFDLVEFLDDLGITYRTKAEINSILESYEFEMDGLLSKFEERHGGAQQNLMQFSNIANQSKDPADERRARKHLENLNNLRYRPEKLNLQYVQLLSETLTGEDRTTFRAAARQHMYPWADVDPPVELVSQMFERDQVLSKDRQTAIRDSLSRYRISRDAIIEDLIRLVRAWRDKDDSDRKSHFLDKAEQRQLDRVLLEKDTLTFIRELFDKDQLESFALDIQLLLSPTPQP